MSATIRGSATGRGSAVGRGSHVGGSSIPSNDTTPPSAPTGLAATGGEAVINLAWSYVVEADPGVSVNVYRSDAEAGTYLTIATNQAGTAYADTTIAAGTEYWYKVAALDAIGNESALSTADNATATASSPDSFTPTSMTLTPMYTSIEIDLPYTLDDNQSASLLTEFKRSADSVWREALPLWRTVPATGTRSFRGKIGLLEPNTAYDVRVTITDPGGVVGANPRTGSASTWADAITAPASLPAASYFTDAATGSDSDSGLTAPLAFASLEKLVTTLNAQTSFTAPVCDVDPDYYQRPTTALTGNGLGAIIKATTLAVGNAAGGDPAPINSGVDHVVIYEMFSAPSSSALAGDVLDATRGILGKGPWTETTLGGVTVYTLDVGVSQVRQLNYTVRADYASDSLAKAAQPLKVGLWAQSFATGSTLDTPTHWAATVDTNLSYPCGFFQESGSTTVYLILPDGLDPNDCYIWMGSGAGTGANTDAGLELNGPNLRVCGVEFRALSCGIRLGNSASDIVIDHVLTRGCKDPLQFYKLTDGNQARRVTIQDCRLTDSNMWDGNIPWRWIKQKFRTSADVDYITNRIGEECETSGIKFYRGGRDIVIRRCTFDGTFNGINNDATNTDVLACRNVDIVDCRFRNIADDCIEPAGASVNWWVQGADAEDVRVFHSTDQNYGPHYFYRCRGFQVAAHGIVPDGRTPDDENSTAGGGAPFKTGGSHSVVPRIFIVHSTFWGNESNANGATEKVFNDAISGAASESWYIRNSIFRNIDFIFNYNTASPLDEDYNAFATSSATNGNRWAGATYNSALVTGAGSIAAYRAATGQGTHSNTFGTGGADASFIDAATLDALLTDAANGDLTLAAGDNPLVGAGVLINGINDVDGSRDLGYAER